MASASTTRVGPQCPSKSVAVGLPLGNWLALARAWGPLGLHTNGDFSTSIQLDFENLAMCGMEKKAGT